MKCTSRSRERILHNKHNEHAFPAERYPLLIISPSLSTLQLLNTHPHLMNSVEYSIKALALILKDMGVIKHVPKSYEPWTAGGRKGSIYIFIEQTRLKIWVYSPVTRYHLDLCIQLQRRGAGRRSKGSSTYFACWGTWFHLWHWMIPQEPNTE